MPTSRTRRASFTLAVLCILAVARTGGAQKPSASPSRAPQGDMVSGISCDAMEGARMHIHQHLLLLDHGKPVAIPANVGQRPDRNCLYWVHTHTPDGIVHVEAPQAGTFTLADFFMIWGEPLSRTEAASMKAAKGTSLRFWVNGQPFAGDPRAIPLLAHSDIVIEAGPPFTPPPSFTNWGSM